MVSYLPLISVIMPAYNAENFVDQALNSVISQTYKNIEILIVDDGSQDRTAEIINHIAQSDHRIILLQQANQGVAAARNLAIQKSSGEYIAFIDADDLWYPQKLEKQLQCLLEAGPAVGLVYTWSAFVDHEGLLTGGYSADTTEGEVYLSLLYSNFVGNASVPLIRRICLEQVGYYNCELKANNAQGCEDWEMYLRLAECYQFRVVPEFLVGYRQTSNGMSRNHRSMAKSFDLVMADVWQRHPEIPTAVYQQASSNFYRYLGGISYLCGEHKSTLFWLYKTLQIDLQSFQLNSASLLRLYKVAKIFVMSLLKFTAYPITFLIWKDHYSWLKFRQWFRLNHQIITISDLNRIRTKRRPSDAQVNNAVQTRTAVRELHLEQLEHGLNHLQGYQWALVVLRLRGAVVGQAWLPVESGHISPATIRASLPPVAWPVWQQLMVQDLEPAKPMLSASVVVCTRDRTAHLAGCLPQLQWLAEQGYEVIVVDNCPSDDSTAKLLTHYPMIRYLHEPRPGLDIARNHGLQAAAGEVVAFTDDDAQVDSGWLPALLRNFGDPMVAIVTGITMPLELETDAQHWFEQNEGFGRGFVRKQYDANNLNPLAAGRVGAGVNMAIRRSAIAHIGLFDEALDCGTIARTGGDQEFFYRTLARGYRIVYEPSALVWHRHRREWSELRSCLHGYGVGVFAWWTRCLLVERELILLITAPQWFWQQYASNLIQSLLKRSKHRPLDLAWAEFTGALAGPWCYLRSRRLLQQQSPPLVIEQTLIPETEQTSISTASQTMEAL